MISGGNLAFIGGGAAGQEGIYLASYQAMPMPVPAMSEWGMIIMIILVGLSVIGFIRRKKTI